MSNRCQESRTSCCGRTGRQYSSTGASSLSVYLRFAQFIRYSVPLTGYWHGHGVAEPPVKSYELRDKSDLINSACCKIPSSNREFWVAKIRRNQERDQQNYNILYENGWHVIVIWECQLTPTKIEHTMREVEVLLEENMLALYKKRTSLPYSFDEEPVLPMAAEDGRN